MMPGAILRQPPRVLTQAQREAYFATGYLAVLFEVVYTITDIPLRPLDPILPTIRLGAGFAFPLSFPVLLIALYIVRSQVASL